MYGGATQGKSRNERAEAEAEYRRRQQRRVDPLAPYRTDCAAFIHDCIVIDNAQPGDDDDATVATMPFHLWDAQRDLLGDILTELLILLLKSRQLGITWLVCAYALWLCLFHPGRLALFFSIGQAEANEMMRRVKSMYRRIPPAILAALPALVKDNTEEMAWDNDSRIQSLPARKTAGSGFTASLVVLDEFAKNMWAREIYTAVKPTIDGGGKMIILSSANGIGNLFYEMVDKALQSLGRFVFRFLPWTAHPDRDAAWYAATEADAISSAHHRQEYPATPTEAFDASGAERFLPSMHWWDTCQSPLPPLDARTPLVLALDAAYASDTFAAVAVSAHPDSERKGDLAVRWVRCWVPPKVKDGELDLTEIEKELRDFIKTHRILQVCYDVFQLKQMMQTLGRIVWCVEFSQGADRLVADKKLLDMIQMRKIVHDGDATLRAHINNADREVHGESKMRIVKRTASLKVDAAVALSMATARANAEFNL